MTQNNQKGLDQTEFWPEFFVVVFHSILVCTLEWNKIDSCALSEMLLNNQVHNHENLNAR